MQAEHAGHLRHQDVHGDAGEKADRDRHRQQIGDAAEAEQAGGDRHDADHERQRDCERLVVGRAGGGNRRKPASKNRRDRGVGAAGQESVAAQHGKADRARDEGEEADLRREPTEPRGRHLLGNRDRRERQPCDQVVRQVAHPVAVQ